MGYTDRPRYVSRKITSNGVTKWRDYATKGVESIAYSHDGKHLAVGSDDEIVLWDPNTGTRELTLTGKGQFYNLMFSPDGHSIVARDYTTREVMDIYMWNINTKDNNHKPQHIINDHNGEIFFYCI